MLGCTIVQLSSALSLSGRYRHVETLDVVVYPNEFAIARPSIPSDLESIHGYEKCAEVKFESLSHRNTNTGTV